MERLDLILLVAFTPIFCLTFLIVLDIYTAFAVQRRQRALERYQPGLFVSASSERAREEVLSGRRHA